MEEQEPVEWLPPQAAGAASPPQFTRAGVDPSWPPPRPHQPARQGSSALWARILGVSGLLLFVFPAGFGLVFLFNLPASIMAWALGARSLPQGRTGMVLGIVGTVAGVLAIVAWGVAIAVSPELRDELGRAGEQGQD